MSPSIEELASKYEDPYLKSERISIDPTRFQKGIDRGDDGAWGVGALVVFDGRGLLVREDETWLLPGGRLKADETPESGAQRELREETEIEIEIIGLGAIAEQTFVREDTNESYEFRFATFIAEPSEGIYAGSIPDNPTDDAVDEVAWHEAVPENTFDRELVSQLFDSHL